MTKAVLFDEFGLENLRVSGWEEDGPGPGQVRIRVHSVSLNYRDLLMVRGHYNPKIPLPLVPCSDGAGEVIAVGEGVEGLEIGDRVCSTMIPDWESGKPDNSIYATTTGGPAHGMLAEERTVNSNTVLKFPDHLSYDEAACLPVAGLTAWTALRAGGTQKGSKVLLLGTGGVSLMGLHIAKGLGAQTVITSSSQDKLERAKEMGVDHGVNYSDHPKWAREVLDFWPDGADTVVEIGGDGTFDQSVRAACVGGCVSLIGVLASRNTPVNLTAMLMRNIKAQGILVGSRADFAEYMTFVEKHGVGPVIHKTFEGLGSAHDALALMASGGHFGKIIIRI